MIDVLATAQLMLRDAKFVTRQRFLAENSILGFEDESLMGFCLAFASASDLLMQWQERELEILKHFSSNFREAREKAWNVYCVFLCAAPGSADEVRQIRWIEENLEQTRKIAACGLNSREDVLQALLPLLPLQYQPQLLAEDASERLRARIEQLAPGASEIVLDDAASAVEAARQIGAW